MKIKLTRSAGGHRAGDTIDRDAKVAAVLVAAGAAVEVEQPKPNTKATEASDAKRTRRSQSRKAKGGDDHEAKTADETAGQEGGGGPHSLPAPTAG